MGNGRKTWFITVGVLLVVALQAGLSAAELPRVVVERSDDGILVVAVAIDDVERETVKTPHGDFLRIGWQGSAATTNRVGAPEVPVVRRLVAIPAGRTASVQWQVADPLTLTLGGDLPERLFPVQAPVPKLPGAAESAPFDYDPAAYTRAPFDNVLATVEALPPVRGQGLALLEISPVEYEPVAGTVTVWRSLRLVVTFGGQATAPPSHPAPPGLRHVVLNQEVLASSAPRVGGNYLILVAQALEPTIAPFTSAKAAQGFNVTTSVVAPGASGATVKQVISNAWAGSTPPDYVLLVGDTDSIPHWTGGGTGAPATDLPYACMDAGDDWMPDLPVGRFPARTTAHLQAMIDKTLYVENGPLADPGYRKRAVFMAGNDNSSITEGTHEWVIATYMEPLGFSFDRLYEVSYGATTQDVRDAFNDGRFYGIYSGHGGNTSWADGPAFSVSDVNGLTNENLYSAVWSFACVTGTYTDNECFMETWVRAPDKGAAVAIGSSVNSWWDEDDILEKRLFDAIFDTTDEVPIEVGPVWNDTRARYIAEMGSGSDTRRYFEMYNIMGDPSLRLVRACSDAGTITLDRDAYSCSSGSLSVTVNDCGLNASDAVVDTVTVLVTSSSEPAGESLLLSETDPASAELVGVLPVSTTDAPGTLWISEGDNVVATYVDADDGQGGLNVAVTATVSVDCAAPVIGNVRVESVEARAALIAHDSSEVVSSIVRYGASCGSLTQSSAGAASATPTVGLTGLAPSTVYFFDVTAGDLAGNLTTDDNSGACYSFSTLVVPDFFTELFEAGNDLDNTLLRFTPDSSGDVYRLCVEQLTGLPVDPTGGTQLALSDDDFEQVALPGGLGVWFYGSTYTSLFVGSNGYVTFDTGDSGFSESFDAHFDQVRISALLDDLNPSSAGTVSWKVLDGGDGIAVTWDGVPEYSATTGNTFQIVIHDDGELWLAYGAVSATDGLAGISAGGGLDPDFEESDLSAYLTCELPPDIFADGFESGACDQWSIEVPAP